MLRAKIARCECSACAFWGTVAGECACKHGQQLKLEYQWLELRSFRPLTDGVARSAVLNRIMVVADNGHMWRTTGAYEVPKPANQRELTSGDDARSVHRGR